MNTSTLANQAAVLAAEPVATGNIKTLALAVFGILLIIGAILMAATGHKAKTSKVAGMGVNYVIAMVVAALGAGTTYVAVGGNIAGWLIPGAS